MTNKPNIDVLARPGAVPMVFLDDDSGLDAGAVALDAGRKAAALMLERDGEPEGSLPLGELASSVAVETQQLAVVWVDEEGSVTRAVLKPVGSDNAIEEEIDEEKVIELAALAGAGQLAMQELNAQLQEQQGQE